VCDLETSRIGAPYIYNVRLLRVNICHLLFKNYISWESYFFPRNRN